MIIKFKGARPFSKHFPDHPKMYTIAPLTFRYIMMNNGIYLPPIITKEDFFGSALENIYRKIASETDFDIYDRKWGKERIYCFGNTQEERKETYDKLRLEEMIYSKTLIDVATDIASKVNHPKMYAKITQGSHSPNFGMGAGNFMSWLDGDVNITFVLDVEPRNLIEESQKLFPNLIPGLTGPRLFYHLDMKIPIQKTLPITSDINCWTTGYGIITVSTHDFFNNYGELAVWKFLTENGYSIDSDLDENFEHMKKHAKNYNSFRAFTKTNLTDEELETALNILSQGAEHVDFDESKTPELYTDSSRDFLDFTADKITSVMQYAIPDFGWSTEVTSLPNININIKNKKFKIIGRYY